MRSLSVVVGRNNGAVTFTPQSGIAALLVQVQSPAGVVLYDSGWASSRYSLLWQAMDDQGVALPPGAYTMQIIVRDAKGTFRLEQGTLQLMASPAIPTTGIKQTAHINRVPPLHPMTAGIYHLAAGGIIQVRVVNHGIPGTDPLPGHNPITGPPILQTLPTFSQEADSGDAIFGRSNSGTGIDGQSNTGDGVDGHSSDGGHSGVAGINPAGDGVHGDSSGGVGVDGSSVSGIGVKASSGSGVALSATSNGGTAINAVNSGRGPGVFGQSTGGDGIRGASTSKGHSGVYGSDDNGTGVTGNSSFGYGVHGISVSGCGVAGLSTKSDGVHGESHSPTNSGVGGMSAVGGMGVWGGSDCGFGVLGFGSQAASQTPSGKRWGGLPSDDSISFGVEHHGALHIYKGAAVYGNSGDHNTYLAGYFDGDVAVLGNLSAANKEFQIDDPIDPAHKYLIHNCVESPDMMNIYNGNVTTDDKGFATIQLPRYFSALNTNFRYQLTVISGDFAQAIISRKINSNHFTLRTSKPHVGVSWQITGVRHDAWARDNSSSGEVPKVGAADGHYLYPAGYHQPAGMGMRGFIAAVPPALRLQSTSLRRVAQIQR